MIGMNILHTIYMYLWQLLLIVIALCAIIFWIKQLLNLLDVIDRWKKHKKE